MLNHLVWTRANWFEVHARWADFFIVFGGMYRNRSGKVVDRSRKRLLADDADFIFADFFRFLNPANHGLLPGFVGRIRDVVQCEDNRVGVKLFTIMELDAFAQVKFQCAIIDLFPALCELAFVLAGHGVAVYQRVPDVGGDNHANSNVVVVRIDVFRRLVVGKAKGVVLFSCVGGQGKGHGSGDGTSQQTRTQTKFSQRGF